MLVAFLSYLRSIIRSHSHSPVGGQPSDYQHPKARRNRITCVNKRVSWLPAKRAADTGVMAAICLTWPRRPGGSHRGNTGRGNLWPARRLMTHNVTFPPSIAAL